MSSQNFTNQKLTGTVNSSDGTSISYQITGNGPGLILIPGVLSLAADYNKLACELAKFFTVYSIERRGRGLSGPQGVNYSIRKECEDVEAILTKTKSTFLFGHSFGGLVALEVSRNNPHIKKVVVYEAAICIDNNISISWIPEYQKSLEKGNYSEAFAVFSKGVGPEKGQRTPLWMMKLIMPLVISKEERKQKYTLLEQNLREHQVVAQQNNSYRNYNEISAVVLIMTGKKTDLVWLNKSLIRLAEVLPHSELIRFTKLNHFGPDKTGPVEVANAITAFLQRK